MNLKKPQTIKNSTLIYGNYINTDSLVFRNINVLTQI